MLSDDAVITLIRGVHDFSKMLEGQESTIKGSLCKKYVSSRDHAVALDRALASVTPCALVDFKAPPNIGKLRSGEKRFLVPTKDLPEEVRAIAPEQPNRSCIVDSKGDTRLELSWADDRRSLWCSSDMGSNAWQPKLKLYYTLGLRGSEKFDPPHRTVRNREGALSGANGKFIKSEFDIVFGWPGGPWNSGGNLQMIKAVAGEVKKNFDYTFILFGLLYERFTRAFNGGKLPNGFGTT